MKVCITGAEGTAGKITAEYLRQKQYNIVTTDLKTYKNSPQEYKAVNLKKLSEVFEILAGCDAVIHFAGNPSATNTTPNRIFDDNFICALNILRAASILDVKKVIIASSVNVYGMGFSPENLPGYLPLDERHPLTSLNTYTLAKRLIEEASKDYSHWGDMSIINLRFTHITCEEHYQKWDKHRDDPYWGYGNLWSYIDQRDVPLACEKALLVKGIKSEVFNITAADNKIGIPSQELMKQVFPEVKLNRELQGFETCISIEKARNILGFEPQYSWKDFIE